MVHGLARALTGFGRRAYRRLFPRLRDELLDAEVRPLADDSRLEAIYRERIQDEDEGLGAAGFLAARYREGMRWRNLLERLLPDCERAAGSRLRVLDLGAGNGAVELALSADPKLAPVSVDRLHNATAIAIHRRAGKPFRRVVCAADRLPFRGAAFDAMLCLETIEHLEQPRESGREAARVLRPNGVILLTTPARSRYAFRPDPHFGIRGLALLPAASQRAVAARRGFDAPHHYVHRLYRTTTQIASLFPGCSLQRILSRSRAPRRWSWDALVFLKEEEREERRRSGQMCPTPRTTASSPPHEAS
ncbi:MAG TPA: class I SAM-dependent methyltransferase [Thermoanaerobaculia bacterium]|nr:class I SAM-dependent methyltransferase [Thermoanaerobaculia bacterium]